MKIRFEKYFDKEIGNMITLPYIAFWWNDGAYCLTFSLVLFSVSFWWGDVENV